MAVFTWLATTAIWGSITTALGLSTAAANAIIAVGRAATWSLGAAALSQPKIPRQQVQATISQTDAPRVRAYGRNLLGGQRVFFEAQDGALKQIVVIHHGAIDGLIRFWWDGEPVTFDAGTGEVERYKYNWFRDGSGAGGDFADVLAAFPTLWTADHRLQNQATFATHFGDPSDEDFASVFPKGAYTVVQAEIRGVQVRNNSGSLGYYENAGYCIRDLMTHTDGWRIPLTRLDSASWNAFSNLCGQSVGGAPRYRLSGFYTLDDALKDVTARMLATCDGQIYETAEGRIGILGGAWSVPDVTITADDILSIEMADGYDPFTDYNVIKGAFISPAHCYQPIEVLEIRDEAALETQEERIETFDVDMCPSGPQLRRLMRIKWAKDHREHVGTIRTNLVGMKARFPQGNGIHTIRIQAAEFGLDGIFEVTSHSFDIPNGVCEIGVASIANAYDDGQEGDNELQPGVEDLETPAHYTAPPVGTLSQQIVTVSNGVDGVKVVVTVTDPGRESLALEAQIASGTHAVDSTTAIWVQMSAAKLRAESGVLNDLGTYTVRVRWRGRSDWVVVGTTTVLANPTTPAAPTSFSAVAAGGSVSLDWINAPTNFYRTRIYRNTVNNFSTATMIKEVAGNAGKVSDHVDSPGTGAWRYWAATINGSLVQSSPTSGITVTV